MPATLESDYLYGILNGQGQFWTPLAFESEKAARQHIIDFWGHQVGDRDHCLRTHRIVPVRVLITELESQDAT